MLITPQHSFTRDLGHSVAIELRLQCLLFFAVLWDEVRFDNPLRLRLLANSFVLICKQETFLHERVKVDKRTGNLAGNVTITRTQNDVTLESAKPFTKRYLKYLTKKFMKKHSIRDFLRVISTGADSYKIAFIQLDGGEAEADEE